MDYRYEIVERRACYRGFFRLDRCTIRHQLFAGGWSECIVREVFERGDAVAVLPYDVQRDSVVMIEQFRVGAVGAPDGAWLLEIVAGVIESGEDPLEVARRESLEEAGLVLRDPLPIMRFIPSPGGCSEHIHLYCARVDAEQAGGVHGLAEEQEDIRVEVVAFQDAMKRLAAGRIVSATPIIALQWLALNRDRLRGQWSR